MLIQKIKSKPGTGKTTLLRSIVNGAPDKDKVLVILSSQDSIKFYRDNYIKDVEMMTYRSAIKNGRVKLKKYDTILMDNCERFEAPHDPVDTLAEMKKNEGGHLIIIGFYGDYSDFEQI